jgi:hypothetical protein
MSVKHYACVIVPSMQSATFLTALYGVIHKSVKDFKNSQQIYYATEHGNSYADRERNFPSFLKESLAHIFALICR